MILLISLTLQNDIDLESDIRVFKQNNITIEEFYLAKNNICDLSTFIKLAELQFVKTYTDYSFR